MKEIVKTLERADPMIWSFIYSFIDFSTINKSDILSVYYVSGFLVALLTVRCSSLMYWNGKAEKELSKVEIGGQDNGLSPTQDGKAAERPSGNLFSPLLCWNWYAVDAPQGDKGDKEIRGLSLKNSELPTAGNKSKL